MQLIYHESTDPYFNLALEEYLLRQTDGAYIVLWRSEQTIVVGKHQNLHAELNQLEVVKAGLRIARRMSGGGTVYHDLGNLNFSFIQQGEAGKLVNFKQFIEPVVDFLQQIQVNAVLNPRNDITVNGLKVSGNAEHVYKNKVLHHGTLLFDADLTTLRKCLRPANSQFVGRGVPSFRSPVGNIKEMGSKLLSIETFARELARFMELRFDAELVNLKTLNLEAIEKLAREKYSTWEWVFGYSPKFELKKEFLLENESYFVHLVVKSGLVVEAKILHNDRPHAKLTSFLLNEQLDYLDLMSRTVK